MVLTFVKSARFWAAGTNVLGYYEHTGLAKPDKLGLPKDTKVDSKELVAADLGVPKLTSLAELEQAIDDRLRAHTPESKPAKADLPTPKSPARKPELGRGSRDEGEWLILDLSWELLLTLLCKRKHTIPEDRDAEAADPPQAHQNLNIRKLTL
jgi:hypothetical protein